MEIFKVWKLFTQKRRNMNLNLYNFQLGKPTRALDTLYDVIKSKKRNNNFSEKLIEQVINTKKTVIRAKNMSM